MIFGQNYPQNLPQIPFPWQPSISDIENVATTQIHTFLQQNYFIFVNVCVRRMKIVQQWNLEIDIQFDENLFILSYLHIYEY